MLSNTGIIQVSHGHWNVAMCYISNTGIIQVSHEHWDVAMCYLILGLLTLGAQARRGLQ